MLMVDDRGLEPLTSSTSKTRSSQLSESSNVFILPDNIKKLNVFQGKNIDPFWIYIFRLY